MTTLKPSKGKLLIAEPSILTDSSFKRSVVLLTEHNKKGSIGFIINKPSLFTLNDIFPDLSSDFIVFNGGPVDKENLYFIHNVPELIPNSIKIASNIYWGGNFETVQYLIETKKINTENIRFFLGYSGWSENQLESELTTSSWVVIKNTFKNILKIAYTNIWKKQLIKFGGDYLIWANAPENPSLN